MDTLKTLRDYGDFAGNVFLGRMYTYKYRALPDRWKENPYFDRFPTTIITFRHDVKTFDGINFNHVDVERRAELLDVLQPFFISKNNMSFFEWKEFREVVHLRKYRLAQVCMRRYRLNNCYAGIIKVKDALWREAIMERSEAFFATDTLRPIKSEKIWLDSLRKSRMIK